MLVSTDGTRPETSPFSDRFNTDTSGIIGLVVEYIVAIDVPWVRLPANAELQNGLVSHRTWIPARSHVSLSETTGMYG